MKKFWFLPLCLFLLACPPREKSAAQDGTRKKTRNPELRAALDVMKTAVNDYVEENQDVKMEYDAKRCLCRYYVGGSFASAEMRWTMPLRYLDESLAKVYEEDGMLRVAMFTVGMKDEIIFEEGEGEPMTVNEFNVYLSPSDVDSGNQYVKALKEAVARCKAK